jgi:hypothetical protein
MPEEKRKKGEYRGRYAGLSITKIGKLAGVSRLTAKKELDLVSPNPRDFNNDKIGELICSLRNRKEEQKLSKFSSYFGF